MLFSFAGLLIAACFAYFAYLALYRKRYRLQFGGWCFGAVLGILIGGSLGVAGFGSAVNGAPIFGFIGGIIGVLLVGNIIKK